MISFLTTLLIALIIFAPACYFANEVFRSSTQAKDNFVDFAKEIEDLYLTGRNNDRRAIISIMDEETAIVYFNSGQEEMVVEADVEFLLTFLRTYYIDTRFP